MAAAAAVEGGEGGEAMVEGRDAVRLEWSNPTTGAWTSDGGEAPSPEGRKGEVVEAGGSEKGSGGSVWMIWFSGFGGLAGSGAVSSFPSSLLLVCWREFGADASLINRRSEKLPGRREKALLN